MTPCGGRGCSPPWSSSGPSSPSPAGAARAVVADPGRRRCSTGSNNSRAIWRRSPPVACTPSPSPTRCRLATMRATLRDLIESAPDTTSRTALNGLTTPIAELHGAVDAIAMSADPSIQHDGGSVVQLATNSTRPRHRCTRVPRHPPLTQGLGMIGSKRRAEAFDEQRRGTWSDRAGWARSCWCCTRGARSGWVRALTARSCRSTCASSVPICRSCSDCRSGSRWRRSPNRSTRLRSARRTGSRIADAIVDHAPGHAGVVVLHGTDTMAYTASALSFLLEGIDDPDRADRRPAPGHRVPLRRARELGDGTRHRRGSPPRRSPRPGGHDLLRQGAAPRQPGREGPRGQLPRVRVAQPSTVGHGGRHDRLRAIADRAAPGPGRSGAMAESATP